MLHWIKNRKISVILYLILLIVTTASMTILNLRIASLFQAAQTKDYVLLLHLFLLLFVWFLLTRTVDYWTDSLSAYIINKIREDIKNNLFEKYIGQSIEDYMIKDAGQYVADFTNDITLIEAKSLESYRELTKSILTIIFGNIAIFSISPIFDVIIIIGIILCVLTPFVLMKYTTKPMSMFIKSFEVYVQRLKDYFNSFFAIKNFAAENNFISKFNQKNRQIEEKKLDAEITIDFVNSLIGRLAWIIELSVISVGVIQAVQGKMEVSVLFSAYLLCNEICMPLQSITGHINNIKSVSSILKKGETILDSSNKNSITYQRCSDISVRFEHFSLVKGQSEILKDINLTFEPNKKYLIIGSNGSGKSTLVKSLKNIYQNFDGNIYINDQEIRTIPAEDFCSIAIYSNETVSLFSESVRDNITLYRDVEDSQLDQALQLSRFKNPLDRKLIDKGRNISSGEKRKLELRRIILLSARRMWAYIFLVLPMTSLSLNISTFRVYLC